MSPSDPLTTVLTQLATIDTASAAIQSVIGTYPAGTAGLSAVEGYLAAINAATAAFRALVTAAQPAPSPQPAPVPTPVPPPTPSPSGVAPLLHDDFTGYNGSTSNLQAVIATGAGGTGTGKILYADGANAKLASIDSTVLYNGHPTMQYTQPGGSASTPELWPTLPAPIDHLWLRAKIRFSPGFTTTGTISGANAYKLLGWSHTTYDGSGRLEITNTNQYQVYWNIQAKITGTLVGGGTFGSAGTISTEWSSGPWYDYIVEVDRLGKMIRCWITLDGQVPVLRATVPESMKDGSQMPQLSGVMIGMNFNQVRAAGQSQALWIGEWSVVDGVKYPNPFGVSGP